MSQLQSQTLGLEVRAPVAGRYSDILSTRRLGISSSDWSASLAGRGKNCSAAGRNGSANSTPGQRPDFLAGDGAHPPGRLDGGPHTRAICRTAAWKSPVPRTGK